MNLSVEIDKNMRPDLVIRIKQEGNALNEV
jgi:hypothetical protein